MATQDEKEQQITFKTNHAASKRFWHWSNFTLVILQLITVFFALVVFSTHNTVSSLQRVLDFTHGSLTDKQTQFMAHSVTDQIWQWHKYIGYAIGALLLFRIIIEFFQDSDQKIFNIVKKAFGLYKAAERNRGHALHYLYSKLSYVFFYIVISVQVITGFGMAFGRSLNLPRSVGGVMHEIHETDLYIILAYVVLHIIGVVWAELHKDQGIVSDMINGGEEA
ncbi:MAG TPA: cytochrome b/b6 domain-containing protein [Balneolaceae bacterium]|nr:cytochrome b/b6 domain-containing protein [Balneolaceae bacterium]